MTYKAVAVTRGCGTRVAGGIYAEVGLAPPGMGRPLEDFLVDPPTKLNREMLTALGVTAVGVSLHKDAHGTWHVLDWVGSESYPNVADFLEEVRRFGLSRRLPKTLEFAKLTLGSRIVLIHARAHLNNHDELYPETAASWPCPTKDENNPAYVRHPDPRGLCCAGLWWRDVDGLEIEAGLTGTMGTRRQPSFSYTAMLYRPEVKRQYTPGIFASFPLSRIAVIGDPSDPASAEDALGKASKSGLPTEMETN